MTNAKTLTSLFLSLALFAQPEIARAHDEVPFIGSFSGEATEEPTNDPNIFLASINGAGSATPIGQCHIAATHLIDVRTLAFTNGAIAFTGKQGTIFGSYYGQFYPAPTPGLFAFLANLTITGGTGKYQGATGRGILSGIVNSNTFPEQFSAAVDALIVLKKRD